MLILSMVMVLVYLGLGCVLVFTRAYTDLVPPPNRKYIGIILMAWGLFRCFSVVNNYRKSRERESDE